MNVAKKSRLLICLFCETVRAEMNWLEKEWFQLTFLACVIYQLVKELAQSYLSPNLMLKHDPNDFYTDNSLEAAIAI